MFDTLCLWFTHCDRDGHKAVKVPMEHMKRAIREAAREEGRELVRLPWETGDEHTERTKDVLR